MDTKKFLQDFVSIFDDEPTQIITMKVFFRDIEGWSSISALALMAMCDEVYDVKISSDDIRNSQTIEDIFNLLNSRMQ
jgi:acyl carrier protein